MSIFRKKKTAQKPIEEGYNAESQENVKFIDMDKTKRINDEIDRIFEEKPLKIKYPDFEAFCKAMKNKEELKLD